MKSTKRPRAKKPVNCDFKRIDVLPEGSLIEKLFRPMNYAQLFEGQYSSFLNLTVSGEKTVMMNAHKTIRGLGFALLLHSGSLNLARFSVGTLSLDVGPAALVLPIGQIVGWRIPGWRVSPPLPAWFRFESPKRAVISGFMFGAPVHDDDSTSMFSGIG
jgi:hypothetical protein